MQTPGHVLINLTLLAAATGQPEAVFLGAALPDVPILTLYFWQRVVKKTPEDIIWSVHYQKPFWLNLIHGAHSIVLAGAGVVAMYFVGSTALIAFFLSGLLHALGDLPVHNRDAHRHFFPLSNYRFMSPFSYWDPRYYAVYVAAIEALLVFLCSYILVSRGMNLLAMTAVIFINVAYATSYFTTFILPGWRSISPQSEK